MRAASVTIKASHRGGGVSQACHGCQKVFMEAERKHHCRSCGEGFCHPCSTHRMPVPERGWGSSPVRVCRTCYQHGAPAAADSQGETSLVCWQHMSRLLGSFPFKDVVTLMDLICFPVCKAEPRGVIARRVTEVAQSTLDMVSSAVDYPLCEC